MGEAHLSVIDRSTHETYKWLKSIAEELNQDNQHAYHALRSVLFATRDCLLPAEALDLGSQLPLFIRGVYFEGYRITDKPEHARSRALFLDKVRRHLKVAPDGIDPQKACTAVFSTLMAQISSGVADHVRNGLHKEIQELWPSPVVH